jgi:hypothetical protein
MAPNKEQPHKQAKENVAALAKMAFVARHGALSLIAQYCEAFGRDPDEVFASTPMGTVTGFLIYFKDRDEYNERYAHIWRTINTDATGGNGV